MRSFKAIAWVLIAIAVIIGINSALNYALYPYTYARADMHHIESGEIEDLIVGTSHGKCGIDPEILSGVTGHKTYNACKGGEYPTDVLYLVKEAARKNDLKRVIYEVDPAYWQVKPNQNEEYIVFYHEMPFSSVKAEYFFDKMIDADYRTLLTPWYLFRKDIKQIPDRLALKKSADYKEYKTDIFSDESQTYREDGFFARHPVEVNKNEDIQHLWEQEGPEKDSLKSVERLISFCEKNDIELVFVMTPIPKVTYEKYEKEYKNASDYMEAFSKDHCVQLFNYWNSSDKKVPSDIEDFGDYDGHLYEDGAARFTRIFAEDLIM